MKNSTYKQLIILLLIFVVGIFSIVFLNLLFSKLVDDLELQTNNHKAKIQLGEFITQDIQNLKGLFFELATTSTNQRMIKKLDGDIAKVVNNIETTLNVLENGGTLVRTVRLNIVNQNSIQKEVYYQKNAEDKIVLEVIDIRPKIQEFIDLKTKLIYLVNARESYRVQNQYEEFTKAVQDLRLFYRSVPAFFIRFEENNSRLLYEGQLELDKLELEIEKKKESYLLIEFVLVCVILFVVLVLGYIISRNINKTNKELVILNDKLNDNLTELENQKLFVRGILDAQSNIVIVTSGTKIIDANRALFLFLNEFDSLDSFLKVHECICDYFIPFEQDDRYVLKKDYGEDNWAEYIYHNPTLDHRVAIQRAGVVYHFKVHIDKQIFGNDEHILVVAFNDITIEVETQRKLYFLNKNLETIVNEKTKELQDLNDNLKQKVIIEVEKNRKKDQQMIQQSRYAALGEMIGNIAHQWRQPLSAISSTSSSVKLQMELGIASNDDIQKSLDDIMGYVSFLNQTIEDFRGFFRQDSKKDRFNALESLESTLKIVSATYKDNDIKIVTDYKSKELFTLGSSSELCQVFLNILNNAKDILLEKQIEDKKIYISAEIVANECVFNIQDNGGGIPMNIIEKVFDPYFTTKHKSQGTGIGLYMSKEIVEKKFEGLLSVKNNDVTYGDDHFNGACFMIHIPLHRA